MMTQLRKPKAARRPAARKPQACCVPIEEALDPRLFKALSDPSRLHLLVHLARSCAPQTVSEAAASSAVDLSVVSRHLRTLQEAGIVEAEKQGRSVKYTVRYGEVVRVLRALADAIEACCPDGACSAPAKGSCCG